MRVQKFLARAGVASRRGSENLMTAGRVSVNGVTVTELGSKVDPNIDEVRVDGKIVKLTDKNAYLLLNKPDGFLTTMSDPRGRPVVASLVPLNEYPGLFPVGRLDKDTIGVLLFMTDGELAAKLLHPSHKVPKTYRAVIEGRIADSSIKQLEQGVVLDDGPTAPATIKLVKRGKKNSTIKLTLTEGRKRQVKRMCSHVGHPVQQLHRESFGGIELNSCPEGKWRSLSQEEVTHLKELVQ